MKGLFGLNNHLDLYEKLKWEFNKLMAEPNNPYLAYNFFVTAWHLLEWRYPNDNSICNSIRDKNPILQICEHIAVGAKHFEPGNPKLKSVTSTQQGSAWAEGSWAPGSWKEGVWATHLSVSLTGDAQTAYGNSIKIEELAQHVMDYWDANI